MPPSFAAQLLDRLGDEAFRGLLRATESPSGNFDAIGLMDMHGGRRHSIGDALSDGGFDLARSILGASGGQPPISVVGRHSGAALIALEAQDQLLLLLPGREVHVVAQLGSGAPANLARLRAIHQALAERQAAGRADASEPAKPEIGWEHGVSPLRQPRAARTIYRVPIRCLVKRHRCRSQSIKRDVQCLIGLS